MAIIKKARTCPRCSGEGKVAVWNPTGKRYVKKTCPVCDGSGKVI